MKKLYVLLLAVMLLTLAACLTACSAVPMLSLADDKLQPPDSPAKDTGEKADPLPQEWSIRLEQVNKENYAEDDRLLAKGSYQVFQLEPEDGGNTLTVTTQTADSINRYFEQWRKSQLQFLADVTEIARTSYAGTNGADPRWEQTEYVYSDTVTTDYWVGPRLLCVSMYYSSYSGGAHPNSWRLAVSFDLNNGQALQMTDLTDDADGMRAAVAESLLYQVKRSDAWTQIGEEGFFEDYQDTLQTWMDQCLIFEDSGITVAISPNTIAPNAAGEQSFQVPYSLLKPYFNERGLRLLGLDQAENNN